MATATRVMSGVEFVSHRIANMPASAKVGDCITGVALSRILPDKTVEEFSTADKLGTGRWAVFFVPKAFTPICSKDHLPGMVKAAEAFSAQAIKIACVAVNTRDEMAAWGKEHDPEGKICMVPDFAGDFVWSMGLGMDKSAARHLGFVAKRAAVFLNDGKVLDVQIEEDAGVCSIKSSAEGLLSRLQAILLANAFAIPFTGSGQKKPRKE